MRFWLARSRSMPRHSLAVGMRGPSGRGVPAAQGKPSTTRMRHLAPAGNAPIPGCTRASPTGRVATYCVNPCYRD